MRPGQVLRAGLGPAQVQDPGGAAGAAREPRGAAPGGLHLPPVRALRHLRAEDQRRVRGQLPHEARVRLSGEGLQSGGGLMKCPFFELSFNKIYVRPPVSLWWKWKEEEREKISVGRRRPAPAAGIQQFRLLGCARLPPPPPPSSSHTPPSPRSPSLGGTKRKLWGGEASASVNGDRGEGDWCATEVGAAGSSDSKKEAQVWFLWGGGFVFSSFLFFSSFLSSSGRWKPHSLSVDPRAAGKQTFFFPPSRKCQRELVFLYIFINVIMQFLLFFNSAYLNLYIFYANKIV